MLNMMKTWLEPRASRLYMHFSRRKTLTKRRRFFGRANAFLTSLQIIFLLCCLDMLSCESNSSDRSKNHIMYHVWRTHAATSGCPQSRATLPYCVQLLIWKLVIFMIDAQTVLVLSDSHDYMFVTGGGSGVVFSMLFPSLFLHPKRYE